MKMNNFVPFVFMLLVAIWWLGTPACAQPAEVQLQPVEVTAQRLSPFAIGARSQRLDSTRLQAEGFASLAEVLTWYTTIATKAYGNGMLTSLSFRGTGASHTAVLWHGINIAYPSLGQNDLAVLPLGLYSDISLQHGAGSALFGSGALGGVINLSNSRPASGTSVALRQWGGSFGTWRNQLQGAWRTKKAFVSLNTSYDQSDNNFRYRNTTRPGAPLETQRHAAYKIGGAGLEAGLKLGKRSQLLYSGQYVDAWRQLQPTMNAAGSDIQTDQNQRHRLQLRQDGEHAGWRLTYAWLRDVIGFNDNATRSDQQILQATANYKPNNKWFWQAGVNYRYIIVHTPYYAGSRAVEQRGGLSLAGRWSPWPRLQASLTLRQAAVTGYVVPLTPTLGLEYLLISRQQHLLWLKGRLARGYRVPTLNERYWQPGGNPDLQPEDAWSAEVGLAGEAPDGQGWQYEITGYRMWVDNWILWRPQGSFWAPANVRYVDVYGAEASLGRQHALAGGQLHWQVDYAFTRSINRTGLDPYDRSVNKQLAYVPVHKATAAATWQNGPWLVALLGVFTGVRYTTGDNERSLPPYALLNARLARDFKLGALRLGTRVNFNNILNTSYQSIENRAMPGFNFLLGISLSYYKPN